MCSCTYIILFLLCSATMHLSLAKHDEYGNNDVEKMFKHEGQKLSKDKTKNNHAFHMLEMLNNLPFLKQEEPKEYTKVTEADTDSDDSEYAEDVKAWKDKSDSAPKKATRKKAKAKLNVEEDKNKNEKKHKRNNTASDDSLSVTFFKLLHGQRNVKAMFKSGGFWHAWKISRNEKGSSRQISYFTCMELAGQCTADKWERLPRMSICAFHLDSIESPEQVCVFPFGETPDVAGECDGGKIISTSLLLEECGPTITTLWRLREGKSRTRKSGRTTKPVLINDVLCHGEKLCLFNTVYEIGKNNITFSVKDKTGAVLYVHELSMVKKNGHATDGSADTDLMLAKMAHSNEPDES